MAYTDAYVKNLIAALERTRDELKTMIADEMAGGDEAKASMMHRMVGSITDDLESNQLPRNRYNY